jgi:hypothetical protein
VTSTFVSPSVKVSTEGFTAFRALVLLDYPGGINLMTYRFSVMTEERSGCGERSVARLASVGTVASATHLSC